MGSTTTPLDNAPFMHGVDRACAQCEAELVFTEIATLIQIVLPRTEQNGQLTFQPFTDARGSLAYEPFFFHDGCWAAHQDSLLETLEEYEVVPTEDAYSALTCATCHSGIRTNEPTGMVQTGDLLRSKRSPNGEGSLHFSVYHDMTQFLCLSCMRTINEEQIEMWDKLSYAGECATCTTARNWRTGSPCTEDHDA